MRSDRTQKIVFPPRAQMSFSETCFIIVSHGDANISSVALKTDTSWTSGSSGYIIADSTQLAIATLYVQLAICTVQNKKKLLPSVHIDLSRYRSEDSGFKALTANENQSRSKDVL